MAARIVIGLLLTTPCFGMPPDWLSTGPFGGAVEIVRTVPKQPNLALGAAANGLMYQSLDGGASWTNRFFPAQFAGVLHTLEVDPRFAGTWYAGVESDNHAVAGVYKTNDGGNSWKSLPGIGGKNVWALAVRPGQPDVVAAGTDEGVFLSRDAGATWSRISPESNRELRPVVSLAFHPEDRDVLYAGTTHLPWRTRDGGAHWESIHSGMIDDSDVFSIAVDAGSPANVFASACSGVYRSGNGGSLWRRMPTPPGAFRTYLVTLDPRRPGVVFAGTSAGLLRSANSGLIWKRVSPHRVKSVAYDPADPNRVYFASSTGGVLVSRDGGNTLLESNTGYANRNFASMAGSGDVVYTSTVYEPGNGGVFRSTDHGLTWRRMTSPGVNENVTLLAAAPDAGDRLYAGGYGGIFRSVDGAKTWIKLPAPPGGPRVTALLALPRGVLLAGSTAGVFRWSGGVWSAVTLPDGRQRVEFLQSSGREAVAAVTVRGAFLSGDAGKSWKSCGQPVADAAWYGLAVDSGQAGIALGATSRGLYRSDDGCASWQPVRDGINQGTVSAVLSFPDRVGEAFASQYGRILQTKDGGRSWVPLDEAGRNGGYPGALLILPEAPQLLFGLFPHRGILSLRIAGSENATLKGRK